MGSGQGSVALAIDERDFGRDDPQTLAWSMVVEQDHPVLGKIRLPNLPFRFSGCDTSPSGPAPLLGQHNREIAESVGYSASDIDAMEQGGVLYSEKQS